jgi:hypothetical protein
MVPRSVSFVFIESPWVKYEELFGSAFERLGVHCEFYPLPALSLDQRTLRNIRAISRFIAHLKRSSLVIFCPGSEELFLREANHLIVFSAYGSWGDWTRTTLLPHPWSAIPKPLEEHVTWNQKPPLSIGFMGTGYAQSKIAKIVRRTPKQFRQLLLRGYHLQWPCLIGLFNSYGLSLKGLNAFARIETIAQLKQGLETTVEVIEKVGFSGSGEERLEFVAHLIRSTYVVCPRGYENFSFRAYEALRYGRVPIIIDTDMRLPPQVDWDSVAIRIPYTSLSRLHAIVKSDYDSKSTTQFMERQKLALATSERLIAAEWLDQVLKNCIMGTLR